MKPLRILAITCAAAVAATAFAQANPFSAFRGKIKDGMYEYKAEMDMSGMPGMPQGMKVPGMTMKHCLKQDDIEKGAMTRGRDGKGMPENCKVENLKMSGNTATYTMTCKGGPDMVADNTITFTGDGYKMDMKMQMNERGQVMNMRQHAEAKYIGPCQ